MKEIKCIIGLGIPYKRSARHSIGLSFISEFIQFNELPIFGRYDSFDIYQYDELFIIEPKTHLNESKALIAKIEDRFKGKNLKLLILHDELDIKTGNFKISNKGGSNGHKGVQGIIDGLKKEQFLRLKIGIGRPEQSDKMISYLLNPFDFNEMKLLIKVQNKISNVISLWRSQSMPSIQSSL